MSRRVRYGYHSKSPTSQQEQARTGRAFHDHTQSRYLLGREGFWSLDQFQASSCAPRESSHLAFMQPLHKTGSFCPSVRFYCAADVSCSCMLSHHDHPAIPFPATFTAQAAAIGERDGLSMMVHGGHACQHMRGRQSELFRVGRDVVFACVRSSSSSTAAAAREDVVYSRWRW